MKQHCHSPVDYEVMPTYGNVCASGWMSTGGGNYKKKPQGIIGGPCSGGLHMPEVQDDRGWAWELKACLLEMGTGPIKGETK
jgi:hypothetical protein